MLKTYRVSGSRRMFDREVGEVVLLDLPVDQERRLLELGSLELLAAETVRPPVRARPLPRNHQKEA